MFVYFSGLCTVLRSLTVHGFTDLLSILQLAFVHSRYDSSLFIYRQGSHTAYLLLYVDDIVLTASSTHTLSREFSMTDLGDLNYFLGIVVSRDRTSMFLSQQKYAMDILEKAIMLNCKPARTPADVASKLGDTGPPVSDLTLYRSLVGALQYLMFTRPNIIYAVQQVCLFMHDPHEPHFNALKRILQYVRGTISYGLQLYASSNQRLIVYSDAD
ncbi:uncharacterized mitochondrial protein AtMg00810-like [Lactuca sativa]|uniref:uncharacterized mitochondrial protein AtMg00810-like n=1 Tax=Lactuca sativa TaxID=4236 RepID=UPI000CD91F33|nr:uncharacterized mitochondrial protein AtMg00810-like [Lactuca sativa]